MCGISGIYGRPDRAAIERMLAHRTGVIGLPLRLLAREVYSKIAARVEGTRLASERLDA